MRVLLAALALAALGCEEVGGTTVAGNAFTEILRWHDDEMRVTCWVYRSGYKGGISCIPDAELRP